MLSIRPASSHAAPSAQPRALHNVRELRVVNDEGEIPAVSLMLVRALVTAAQERGVTVELPELAGIDLATLTDPALALPREAAGRVCQRIAQASGDPNIMLELGRATNEGHYHFAGPLLANQMTARKALELGLMLRRNVVGGPAWRMTLENGLVRVAHPAWNDGAAGRLETEFEVSTAYHIAVRFWGAWAASSMEVEFSHARPASGPDYERFFGARLRFGAALNGFVFPEALLDYQRPAADAELAARLTDYARDKYLHDDGKASWSQRVEYALREATGPAGLELHHVARHCRVSTRTLRRRLAEELTTFSDLRARVRVERAATLLVQTDQPVTSISAALGYSDVNSFRRAFQRWAGRTPAQYRVARGRPAPSSALA